MKSICEACQRGDHQNCGMQSWCACEDDLDGQHGEYYPEFDPYDSNDDDIPF